MFHVEHLFIDCRFDGKVIGKSGRNRTSDVRPFQPSTYALPAWAGVRSKESKAPASSASATELNGGQGAEGYEPSWL
jgi:hypothetical protein